MTAKKKESRKSSNSKARIREKNHHFAIPRSFYIPREDLLFVRCFMKVSTERCDEEKENQILVVCEEEFFLDSQKDDVRVSHDVIEMSQVMAKKIRSCNGKQK